MSASTLQRPARFAATAGMAIALAVGGCSRRAPDTASATAGADSGVVLDSAQRAQIRTEVVAAAAFTPLVMATATVAFNGDHSTAVISPISGPVSRLLVSPGAHVTRGQALATVASPDFAEAVASYRKAESAWRNAERIAKLDEQLFANDALARRDLDQARTDFAAAAADRDASISQMRALGVDEAAIASMRAGRSTPGAQAAIRAPLAGTVVERTITPGQLLEAGATQTFIIADLSSFWVMANVFEGDVGSVRKGETALVTTAAASDTLRGTVDYVAALVDPATKATAVRIVVPDRGGLLRRDMLVNVQIRSDRTRTGILVPVAAVLRNDENLPYVFVAGPNGAFARRRVELGSRIGDRYEITSGLADGEAVVIDGALYLAGSGAS